VSTHCSNCGSANLYKTVFPIDEDLAASWELDQSMVRLFNKREGLICPDCNVSRRGQGLALAILKSKYGYGQKNLHAWVKVANQKKLKVAELNSCHKLHEVLKNLDNLTYAEYGTPTEQDIQALNYKSGQFDIVLHSETLEHINDPVKAMDECRRISKDDGVVLFTTPVLWSRKTRRRAHIDQTKIINDLPSSYHGYKKPDYLVFYEYGRDIDDYLGAKVYYMDWKHQNYVFISGKHPTTIHPIMKIMLRLLENTALNTEGQHGY
jgi:SAM-dependent methyltransferase